MVKRQPRRSSGNSYAPKTQRITICDSYPKKASSDPFGRGFLDDKLPGRSTPFPIYPMQAARPRGTCNYPLSLFACLFRQAHALRSFGQPIYIEVSGLRVIQVLHGLSCLLDLDGKLPGHLSPCLNSSASLVLYQGDKRPGSFVIGADLLDKTRIGHARSAERVRQRGDSSPTKFI